MFRIKKLLCLLLAVMMICSLLPAAAFADGAGGCTKQEDCTAETHEEGCPKFVPAKSSCTKADDCAAETHEEGCPKFVPAKSSCTKAEDCAAETHEEGCLSLKKGEPEPEVPAAVQAFLDAVAAIVIPENPEEMDEDSYAAMEAQIEVAMKACEELSQEEQQREDVLAAWAIMSAAMDILDGGRTTWRTYDSVPLNLTVSSYGAPFLNGSTGQHSVNIFPLTKNIKRADACGNGENADGSATARFIGSNESGWTLVVDIVVGNYKETVTTNARVKNKDMSKATGTVTFGMSWNTSEGVRTTVHIKGAQNLPAPTYSYKVNHVYRTNGVQDETYTETISNVPSGTTVQLSSITQKPIYNSKTYTYTAVSPESAIIKDNSTVFTLYYDRTEKPAASVVENLLANGAVTVECVNETAGHDTKTYGLISGSYDTGEVEKDATGVYTCTITIQAEKYVEAYNKHILGHTLDDAESKTITLNFNASSKTWTVASGAAPVTFEVKCVTPPAPTSPAKPTENELNNLQAVTIDCVNDPAGHANETYSLIAGSYTVGDVTWDATNSCYQCSVTVNDPTNYVNQYNVKHSGHSLDPEVQTPKTITLNYVDNAWTVVAGTAVTFTVKCVTPPSPTGTPDAPDAGKLAEQLGQVVKVDCVNADVSHADQTYALIDDSYEIGAVEGNAEDGYTCTVTIFAADYVVQYNIYTGVTHELDPAGQTSKTVTLAYDEDTSWTPEDGAVPVTFTVKCVTPPSPPVKPTENAVKTLLGEAAVKIDCVNTGLSHADGTYGLIDGSFTVGNVEGNATGLFTCTVTIQAAKYVDEYNKTNAGHSLATGEALSKTITLKYDAAKTTWTVPANAAPVVFQVVCSTSQPATDWSKLTITKTVSPTGTVMPGDTVTYTITVTNNTGKILSGITVSETLDRTKLESFVASADKDYNFTSGTWRIWALANGSSTTLTISAKVKADATGTINNTATITGAGDGGNGLPQGSGGSSSVSITVGTPAPMNKFTLSYNANGGKGAPSSQSVETTAKIVVMTVSSVKPTRDGYHFCGWALTPNGHVSYRPGNEITLTGDVTLYAVWATPTSSPQTGDSSNVALWAAMAGMSLAAGAVVLFVLKKRKAE